MISPLPVRRTAALALSLALSACASLPPDRGRSQVHARLAEAGVPASDGAVLATPEAALDALLDAPLSADDAVAVAWLRSPRVELALAGIGRAAADLFESARLRNPTLSASRVGGSDGTTSVGISAIVSDLLTLPSRRRIGAAQWHAAVAETAHTLLDEATRTRVAYYHYIGAKQVAALRDAVAEAAGISAELAQRFRDAGNISALQLAREQAAATVARTAAARARAARLDARMALAEQLGLAGVTNRWRTPDRLPLPPEDALDVDSLLAQARAQRLDLAAARAALEAGEDAASLARRFGWLGEVELGLEREHENGERYTGPTLALSLPLFQQGQAGVARAEADRDTARATIAVYEQAIERDVRAGVARLATLREIVESYRDALIPQRETIVARELERYNFMLIGAFELIQARQDEFDAYQDYLEAIRDYWLARVELSRVVGVSLPGEPMGAPDAQAGPADVLDRVPAAGARGHGHHHGSAGPTAPEASGRSSSAHPEHHGSDEHHGHEEPHSKHEQHGSHEQHEQHEQREQRDSHEHDTRHEHSRHEHRP